MPQPNLSFLEEARDAALGTWALVLGRQEAPRYFDFSMRGVIGSFIALIIGIGVSVFGPMLVGVASPAGAATSMTMLSVVLYVFQIGAAYVVLNMMGRLDGFMPYLVADNWVNFFVALAGSIAIIFLGGSDIMLIVMGIVAIIIEVNIARRIVTLAPMQIAIFIVAQVVANFIGLLLFGGLMLQALGPLPAAS
ncbi:hypothetical protein SAMN06295905_0083 [Devosia lucknowensis]|uniref:Yip1 domain-containing protein n=1 Tax=Devosia lucknowensis TaxID=1096929 RepID=A0A1Y6E795_9HYPH|nr:hypothetical protein [Devosia lucknowensis]SMQ58459.1 hypothetical protein SAMN06295905_0083 [Devosia lucknowensis]